MGIELLEGRDFDDGDLEPGARVSIVNETMAPSQVLARQKRGW